MTDLVMSARPGSSARRLWPILGLLLAAACGSSGGGDGQPPSGDAPVARLAVPTVASAGVPVSVNALASTGAIARYRFDFGDGTPVVQSSTGFVLHRFQGNGSRVVRVEVEGPGGRSAAEAPVNLASGVGATARFDLPRERVLPSWKEVPFPNDLLIDPETGRIALAGLSFGSPLAHRVLEAGVNGLTGFGTSSAAFLWVDGEMHGASLPADEQASLAPGASVFVINVDARSPEYRRRAPVQVRWSAEDSRISVLPVAGAALRPGTKYAVVARTDVWGAPGSLVAPPTLSALLDGRAPDAASGQRARQLYGLLREALVGQADFPDADLSGIASATVFTTQPIADDLIAIREAMDRGDVSIPDPAPDFQARHVFGRGGQHSLDELLGEQPETGLGLSPGAHQNIATVVTRGTLRSPSYLSRDATFLDPYGGTFASGEDGPVVQGISDLPFTLVLPAGPMPATGYPVVIAQHGLGGDRADIVAMSNELTSLGFAVVGADAIQHGQRYDVSNVAPVLFEIAAPILEEFGLILPARWIDEQSNYPGTLDGPDGWADRNPVGSSIAFFEAFINIAALRDNFRQNAVDLMQLGRMVAGPDLEIPGLGAVALDEHEVFFVGWSLGGMIGAGYLPFARGLRGVVLDSAGAGIAGHLLTNSPALAGQLGPVANIAFGIPASSLADPFDPFIALSQTILDAADPINLGRHVIREPLAFADDQARSNSVLLLMAMWDELVPNASNEALARELGLELLEPSYRPVPGVPSGGSRLFGNVRGRTAGLAQYAPAEHFAFLFRRTGQVFYRVGFPFAGEQPFPFATEPFDIRLPLEPAMAQVLDFLAGIQAGGPGTIEMKLGYRPRADHDDDGVLDGQEGRAGTDPSDPTSRP